MNKSLVKPLVVLAAIIAFLYVGVWKWGMSRVYVGPDEILVITSKFGADNEHSDTQRVVAEGTKGIWKNVRGEGRHFFSPIEYSVDARSEVVEIEDGQVGLVESLSGDSLPQGEFIVHPGKDQKGIEENVLTPGKWRLNPFAYKITPIPATMIRPGFVGVVTRQTGEFPGEGALAEKGQRGIQKNVLQPGIYYLNPRIDKVEEIWVGYNEITLEGVTFPSKDGFTIQLDISVVWGLLPKDVPGIINRFGNAQAVIDKIIRPQLESICRIEGSKYGAKEFIEGTSRELFQKTFTEQLVHETKTRNIDVLLGLVRDIHVPLELREPIQKAKIAAEEQLTKEEQRKTQVIQNELEELKAGVEKGVREVGAETEQKVANVKAEGARKVATIGGDKEVAIAEIRKKVAEIEAQRERILGKADAEVIELLQKAEADRFQKMVQAMGDPEAYANYIFATKLSDDLRIHLRYAGPGTFWTDLPPGARMLEDAAARKILEKDQRDERKR
jgi:regulator of protease activity HflC (stomatin/prohibitin superfamily)